MKRLSIIIISITTLLLFNSCDKEDSNPLTPGTGGGVSNQSGRTLPPLSYINNFNGTMATIQFGTTVPIIGQIDVVMGYAMFGSTSSLDAGNVAVNNENVPKQQSSNMIYYSSYTGTSSSTLNNVVFNGSSTHNWNISGSSAIPAFTASVVGPNTFTINSPTNNATVTKAGGINVNWSNANSQDSVLIQLISTADSKKYYNSGIISNSGSYTIPEASLSQISGQSLLEVVKFRYAIKESNGKQYVVLAEVIKNVVVTVE